MKKLPDIFRYLSAKPVIGLVVLYGLSYGFIPLNGGKFWDDWTLVGVQPSAIIRDFIDYGIPQQGYFLAALASPQNSVYLSRAIIFLSFLGAGVLLYAILKTMPAMRNERWYIAALFVAWPVNFARISLATLPYAVCQLLFFFSWWVSVRFTKNINWRILSLITFFTSFSLNSLLVYYVLFLVYRFAKNFGSAKKFIFAVLTNADYLALPIIYWVMQNALFPPQAAYATYNAVTMGNLVQLPIKLAAAFHTSFFEPLTRMFTDASIGAYITMIVAALLTAKFFQQKNNLAMRNQIITASAGVLSFTLGLTPYLLAGHTPTYFEWTSRHQLLVPLGAGLMILAAINTFFSLVRFPQGRSIALVVLVAAATLSNGAVYFSFVQDWLKQESLAQNFSAQPMIEQNRTFVVRDEMVDRNAINRFYRFYEYNGILRRSFGTQTRLAIPEADFSGIDDFLTFRNSDRYSMTTYVADRTVRRIIISPGDLALSSVSTLRLLGGRLLHTKNYRPDISQVTKIVVE